MKILLANAVDERDVSNAPHLGLGYLASFIRDNVGIKDIKIVESDVIKAIENYKPDVVGITSVSQNFDIAKAIAKKAKDLGAITIVGGVHVTLLPFSLDESMDIGVIGEGEKTLLEIIQVIEKYGKDHSELEKVKGIVFWGNGNKIKFTGKRELIPEIDSIPYPARDLIDYHDWEVATIFTSRGCPFNCVFCSSTRIWERVRYNSPDYVVGEIKYLIEKYNTKHITINDDLFIADPRRAIKISELVVKEGINEKVTFNMSCRASLVTEDVAVALKKMGTELISMGLESGSPTILKFAKGPHVTVIDNENAINIIKKHGMRAHGTFIIGFPMDTRDTVLETYNFIKKSRLDSFEVYILAPMPGTPIWDYAVARGLVSNGKEMKWSKIAHRNEYDFMEKIVLTENLTKNEIYSLYKRFVFERKKRKAIHMVKNAIKHPYRIPLFLKGKMKSFEVVAHH